MHEIREENGTARPIQRKLTSQLQVEEESEEKKARKVRHLAVTSLLTRDLVPVLLEVRQTTNTMNACVSHPAFSSSGERFIGKITAS